MVLLLAVSEHAALVFTLARVDQRWAKLRTAQVWLSSELLRAVRVSTIRAPSANSDGTPSAHLGLAQDALMGLAV